MKRINKTIKQYIVILILFIICVMIITFIKRIGRRNTPEWKIFEIVKIADCKGYIFNDLSFIDNYNGIIEGEYRDDDVLFVKSVQKFVDEASAVIFQTVDSGENWKQIYNSKGKIYSISHVSKEQFYALKITTQGDTSQEYSHILKYQNDSNRWEEVNVINKPMRKIIYFNSNTGLIIGYENQQKTLTEIMMTKDGGKNWETLKLQYKPDIFKPIIKYNDSKLYYFSGNTLVLYDLISNEEHIQELPQDNIEIRSICLDDENKLWLLAKLHSDIITLYKQNIDNIFERVILPFGGEELSPLKVQAYNNKIFIFLVDIHSSFFPRWKVFRSSDNGVNWNKEELPISVAEYVISSYQNDYIWVLTPDCRLQRRH